MSKNIEDNMELIEIYPLELNPIEKAKIDLFEIQTLKFNAGDKVYSIEASDVEKANQLRLFKWLRVLFEKKLEDFKFLAHRDLGEMRGDKEIRDLMREVYDREKQKQKEWGKQ